MTKQETRDIFRAALNDPDYIKFQNAVFAAIGGKLPETKQKKEDARKNDKV